jgi:adenosylcobinamide-GDP ribazoletransferase
MPRTRIAPDDLRRASALFPLVGLGVAGVGIATRAAVAPLWGPGVATVAAIAAMIVVTGAFHEDGLADTADGLWGGWDPPARLAIMRDSRIGTYGTVALVIAIGLRAGLLLPLGLADFARAVACGHVLGRASTLLLARLLPVAGVQAATGPPVAGGSPGIPPRREVADDPPVPGDGGSTAGSVAAQAPLSEDGGTGGAMGDGRPRLGASVVGPIGAGGILLAVVVVAATVVVAAGALAVVPLGAGLAVCLACAGLFRRRLGGLTGDTLGAANQIVDLAVIAAVAALARAGLL